jgi:predicted phage baseplate assembly protein
LGHLPEAATAFRATYRVGNGPSGNVGAEAISYIVTDQAKGVNLRPRNPLPARSGVSSESLAEVRLFAPGAFRKQLERAITSDDYASVAARNPKLQRAGATLRWNGSWHEALVAIDPLGTEAVDAAFSTEILNYLYPFRRMGHDLVVAPAKYVPLKIAIRVCVLPHYLRGHVEAELLNVLSNRRLPDGSLGFFHPDNLSFGEGVDLSRLVAAVQGVKGVESVEITEFHRLFEPPNHEIENGILPLGPFEIAQLDNDPTYPEHGLLSLTMRGGR